MNSFNYSHAAEDSVHDSKNSLKLEIEEEVPRFSTVETLPKISTRT